MNIPVIPDSWGDEISTAVFIISMLVMRVGLGDVGKYHISQYMKRSLQYSTCIVTSTYKGLIKKIVINVPMLSEVLDQNID